MGANGWRTAHNPPTPALLDETDRQGMLVWDENHRNIAEGEVKGFGSSLGWALGLGLRDGALISALLDETDRQGMLIWDENHRSIAAGAVKGFGSSLRWAFGVGFGVEGWSPYFSPPR